MGQTFKIVNRYGTLYVAFNGLRAENHNETWSTSYTSETIYIKLRDCVDFLESLGLKVDVSKLVEDK